MGISRRIGALAVTTGLALGIAAAAPASASAHPKPLGQASLAALLTSDNNRFDRTKTDYDIVTEAVLAVLAAKPNSPVGLLADGSVALTAFVPNDQAFRLLVKDLTGRWVPRESDVFAAVAGLGIDTVETVLLYHVVPGAAITGRQARKANGAVLTTAQGGTITVKVLHRKHPVVVLKDKDRNDANPYVVQFDLNKGNRQIAHGISFVLRPVNL